MAREPQAPCSPTLNVKKVNEKEDITNETSKEYPSYTKNIRISGTAKFRDEDKAQDKNGRIDIDVFNETDYLKNGQYRKLWGEAPTFFDSATGEWYYDKPAEPDKKYIFDVRASIGEAWAKREVKIEKKEEDAQFCDPLDTMKIRKNRASNLMGKVRSNNTVNHQGFDYYASSGTNIKAVSDGKVTRIVNPSSGDYGIQLVLKINNSNYYAFYAHLSAIDSRIKVDTEVKKGDIIGKTGNTGNASSMTGGDQHLHFECRTSDPLGTGLNGRLEPNLIVATKFYSRDTTKNQTNVGVKKIEANGTETLMDVE